ncbi:OmpH family outer membrane protein [Neolewinella sp.]|uniref:OmpH family outer membrane protein n=1 Tax=Neolewinella sp. TaxID=2993543 RepID=UPI003B519708
MLRSTICCLLLLALTGLHAQKYGHLNFAILISELPGTEAAEAELKAFNDAAVAKGEQMVVDLKARVAEVEAQREELPPVRVEELRQELSAERDKIVQYEQQMGIDVERKRQELLGPVIQQAREAVEAVAEENGYQLIFDTSRFNTVLYGQDSDDIKPLVRAKLGM